MVFIAAVERSPLWKHVNKRFMEVAKGNDIDGYLIQNIKEHVSAEDAAAEYVATIEMVLEKAVKESK